MFSQVFAGTSKCKSWTGTGSLSVVDCVAFAIAALDCACVIACLYFEWVWCYSLELTASLVEAFDS